MICLTVVILATPKHMNCSPEITTSPTYVRMLNNMSKTIIHADVLNYFARHHMASFALLQFLTSYGSIYL
jgi:uncharacterized membrane protein YdfJ with MMPL/SSD domain